MKRTLEAKKPNLEEEVISKLDQIEKHVNPENPKNTKSGGGCGCLSILVFILLVWALLFGVTVDGKHYGLGCSCNRGVVVGE